ncbi:NlpC/P60 family protein [Planococcus sp. ANT_H30]|nr:NlpC/P60 family protein [Planococcus sp. ANT_H30]
MTLVGFDCSGFLQCVYNKTGQSISRTTLPIFSETKQLSSQSQET